MRWVNLESTTDAYHWVLSYLFAGSLVVDFQEKTKCLVFTVVTSYLFLFRILLVVISLQFELGGIYP